MTDAATNTGAPAAPASTVIELDIPGLSKRSFDAATIPGDARLALLFSGVHRYIANRVNAAVQRHNKDEAVIAWTAYDNAQKADPMQSAVPQPTVERPAAPDLEDAYKRAVEALTSGEIRRRGDGSPRARKTVDPLVKLVTQSVVREVYEARKAADATYTYLKAQQEVGADGVAYLNKLIDAKVEAGAVRADLEKMRDVRYINPAKIMLGQTDTKAIKELPSIL